MKSRIIKLPIIITTIILAAILIISCATGEKITLGLNLQNGKSYYIKTIVEQNISQKIMGQTQDISQTIGMGYTFTVESIDESKIALVTVTYNHIYYKQSSGILGETEYDSKNPPEEIPLLAKGFSALVDKSFTMKISPDGKVIEVDGVTEILTDMINNFELFEGAQLAQLQSKMEKEYGNKAIKQTMEQMLAIFPDKPVSIGDIWTKEVNLSKQFPLIMKNTWELANRQGGIATLDVNSEINSEKDDSKNSDLSDLIYDVKGNQKGSLEIDESTGWILGGKMVQSFSGEISTQGLTWPISVESIITFENKDK
ncbi:MAG: hypothetical protein K9J13_14420 [Saprospiraceae bacterium]|nr:hypothetical protein [Saprospiraceae bacterium]